MSESALASRETATGTVHPIRNAAYRRWLLGSTVSMFGDQFYLVALPWLILQGLGLSAEMLGTVMMVGALPRAALMLVGGAVTDRVSARLVMLMAAAVRAVCVAAIGCLTWLGILSTWEVYALVIVFGIADAFAIPAQTAYMPALLKEDQLVAGLSFGQGCNVIAYTLGPLPAGLVVARFGPGPAFIINALGFLFVIAALLRLPDPPVVASQATPIGAIRDGIAHVLRDVPLWTMMLLVAAANLFGGGPTVVGLAFLASSRFGSSAAYGVILSAVAAGAFVGTLAGGAWKVRQRGLVVLVCLAINGIGLMVTPFVPGIWGLFAVQAATGVAAGVCTLHIMAWIMQRVDVAFRGRVSSVLTLSSWGMEPISMALAGFLALWGVSALFVLPGACLVAVVAAAASLRSVREIK
jgi:MFS family permease